MGSSIRKKMLIALCLSFIVAGGIALFVKAHGFVWLMHSHNVAKNVALALHQYHDTYDSFPPVVVRDANGNALHSWRTLVQSDIADISEETKYNPAEPWHSHTNQKSAERNPANAFPYQFLAIVGSNAAWSAEHPRKIADFKDGTSTTALVVGIRNSGVRWSEPIDASVTATGSLSVNGHPLDLSSDVFVITADGAVHYAEDGFSSETISSLVTIDGGENVAGW